MNWLDTRKGFQGKGYALEISRAVAVRVRNAAISQCRAGNLPENLPSLHLIQKLDAVPAGVKDGCCFLEFLFR